jgi:rod shape-determining protein MreB
MLPFVSGLFGPDLAIDLGTANTLIGVPGAGVVLDEPSVVAVSPRIRGLLPGGCAVGHLARQMFGRSPESVTVVRPLRDGVITDSHLCETMLRYFLRKVRPQRFGPRPRVVIAVPGSLTAVEKRAVYSSALRSGARQVFLIAQANAAALGAGLPITEPLGNLIVDIGGGTTEVAVLSVSGVVAKRSLRVGGDQMDQALVDHLRRRYALRIGPAAAERLRIDGGSAAPLEEERAEEVAGVDIASGLPRRVTVTSPELREALAESLDRIVDAIRETVDNCGPDLAADLVTHGMVLTGGGALLRSLDQFLAERTGIPARVASDPATAVARGTLICLENFGTWRGTLESTDDDT